MATSNPAYAGGPLASSRSISDYPRHSFVVRITHWITALGFAGLLVSGIAILLSHPRLYWGETGNIAMPSLIDLPLPFILANQNGWGRYLHFLSAWGVVLSGAVYVFSGLVTAHFRKNLLPAKADLNWKSLLKLFRSAETSSYNVLQRITYLIVVFGLFPFVIWTGLAMSPALVSVIPSLVTVLDGHQSARTLHFFVAVILVLFVIVHLAMIALAGFWSCVRPMITGHAAARKGDA
jgi:thiosulfate reductase cytochrome b subunit